MKFPRTQPGMPTAFHYYHFVAAATSNKIKIHESLKKHLIRIRYFPEISNYRPGFPFQQGPV